MRKFVKIFGGFEEELEKKRYLNPDFRILLRVVYLLFTRSRELK